MRLEDWSRWQANMLGDAGAQSQGFEWCVRDLAVEPIRQRRPRMFWTFGGRLLQLRSVPDKLSSSCREHRLPASLRIF